MLLTEMAADMQWQLRRGAPSDGQIGIVMNGDIGIVNIGIVNNCYSEY